MCIGCIVYIYICISIYVWEAHIHHDCSLNEWTYNLFACIVEALYIAKKVKFCIPAEYVARWSNPFMDGMAVRERMNKSHLFLRTVFLVQVYELLLLLLSLHRKIQILWGIITQPACILDVFWPLDACLLGLKDAWKSNWSILNRLNCAPLGKSKPGK